MSAPFDHHLKEAPAAAPDQPSHSPNVFGEMFGDISGELFQQLHLLEAIESLLARDIIEPLECETDQPIQVCAALKGADRAYSLIEILSRGLSATKRTLDDLHSAYLKSPANPESEGSEASAFVDPHRATAWSDAVTAYNSSERATIVTNDLQSSAVADALHRLIRTRVPDLDALREKVRIARDNLALTQPAGGLIFTQILADIDHLN